MKNWQGFANTILIQIGEKDGRIEIDDNSQHYAAKAKWVTGSSLFYLILAYSTLIISEFGLVTIIVMTMRTRTTKMTRTTTTMTMTMTTMLMILKEIEFYNWLQSEWLETFWC